MMIWLCFGTGMGVVSVGPMVNMQATATIAKELLKSGNSPTAEAMVKQSLPSTPQNSLQASLAYFKTYLKYLNEALCLDVQEVCVCVCAFAWMCVHVCGWGGLHVRVHACWGVGACVPSLWDTLNIMYLT